MSATKKQGLGLRVLYVEDDPDVQEMLGTLLEMHGYTVQLASSVAEGLETLRRERFHLVIADYNLPDGDGAEMLATAAREGHLQCESLIITGAYSVGSHATAFRVVRKPIDATALIHRLDEILAPARASELAHVASARKPAAKAPVVDLVLYITEASRASLRAVRRLQELVAGHGEHRVSLRIVDVSRERSPEFDEDRIAFTPTLVKRGPGPKVYFLGALDRLEDVAELLGDHADGSRGPRHDREGVDRRTGA